MIEETIEIGGKRLEAARWSGDGESGLPILMMHEGLGSIRLWKGFPERLARAAGREVIAWSRLGHGWSEARDMARGVGYMHDEADLLPEVHAALGLERAHWLGHSDGGSIALIGAARHPGLCASLIVEAPHVFVEDLTSASIAQVATEFVASGMGERMKRHHDEPVALFRDWSAIWLTPEFRDWDIEEVLPGIAAPALLIQGRDDQYGTMAQLDHIEAVLAETRRLELEDCGHSPHLDREDAVIAAICAFLDGKD